MFKESDIDWSSSAKRLAEVMQPYYDGQKTLTEGMESLRKNTKYSETITKLDNGNYLRTIRCDAGSDDREQIVRAVITEDDKTYPGEYYLAPRGVVSGIRAKFYKGRNFGEWLLLNVTEYDREKMKKSKVNEYIFGQSARIDMRDPIAATQVWLPKLKAFFQ